MVVWLRVFFLCSISFLHALVVHYAHDCSCTSDNQVWNSLEMKQPIYGSTITHSPQGLAYTCRLQAVRTQAL